MHQRMYLCNADGQLAAHLPCNMHNAASFCSRPYREKFFGGCDPICQRASQERDASLLERRVLSQKMTQRWAIVSCASSLSELCHALQVHLGVRTGGRGRTDSLACFASSRAYYPCAPDSVITDTDLTIRLTGYGNKCKQCQGCHADAYNATKWLVLPEPPSDPVTQSLSAVPEAFAATADEPILFDVCCNMSIMPRRDLLHDYIALPTASSA